MLHGETSPLLQTFQLQTKLCFLLFQMLLPSQTVALKEHITHCNVVCKAVCQMGLSSLDILLFQGVRAVICKLT